MRDANKQAVAYVYSRETETEVPRGPEVRGKFIFPPAGNERPGRYDGCTRASCS
jgi:hypothetical protein